MINGSVCVCVSKENQRHSVGKKYGHSALIGHRRRRPIAEIDFQKNWTNLRFQFWLFFKNIQRTSFAYTAAYLTLIIAEMRLNSINSIHFRTKAPEVDPFLSADFLLRQFWNLWNSWKRKTGGAESRSSRRVLRRSACVKNGRCRSHQAPPFFWLPPTRASQVAHLSAGISRHSVHFIHFIRSNSIESFDVGGELEIKNSNEISFKFTPMAAPSALMTRTKASRIAPAVSRDLICIPLTLCLSTLIGRRLGSKSSLSGSMLMGDWRRPLLHSIHCGLIRPQNDGPSFA